MSIGEQFVCFFDWKQLCSTIEKKISQGLSSPFYQVFVGNRRIFGSEPKNLPRLWSSYSRTKSWRCRLGTSAGDRTWNFKRPSTDTSTCPGLVMSIGHTKHKRKYESAMRELKYVAHCALVKSSCVLPLFYFCPRSPHPVYFIFKCVPGSAPLIFIHLFSWRQLVFTTFVDLS